MTQETFVHATAIIEKGAELAEGVYVGPFCVVGAHVRVGKGTHLQSHVSLTGYTTLGEDNEVYPFASVGNVPQDLKHKGEKTVLVIGNRNKIRECATLQPGTVPGGGKTVIGDDNLLMAYTHVAHDCIIGNRNVIVNGSQISGHVQIDNDAVIAGVSGIHQNCRVGDFAMVGAGSMVNQDVPPFTLVQGDRATVRGLNIIGLRRKGFTTEKLAALKNAYRFVFGMGAPTVEVAVERCRQEGLLVHPEVQYFVEFIQASKRGVARPASDLDASDLV